jgi:hypothetical protein
LIAWPPMLLKGEIVKSYYVSQNMMAGEKLRESKSFLSKDFIVNIWNGEAAFHYFFLFGMIFLLLLLLKHEFSKVCLLYIVLYTFMMSFTTGVITYGISTVSLLYLFFAAGIFSPLRWIKSRKKQIIFSVIASILMIAMLITATAYNFRGNIYVQNRNFIMLQDYFYDTYVYLKAQGINNTVMVSSISTMILYYAGRDKLNLSVIDLEFNKPSLKNFTGSYVSYVNIPRYNLLREDNIKRIKFEEVRKNCKLEKEISDKYFSEKNSAIMIFNCYNKTINLFPEAG